MTFTEAAIEVLRRSGKPLHFKEIAQVAVDGGLLSHVGQTPEATMGARLVALAKRDADRPVMAIDAGTFALPEWGITPQINEPVPVPEPVDEPPMRVRERHPARQEEVVVATRRDERRRPPREDDEGRRKRRYAPPAELAHAWLLRERKEGATFADIAKALREKDTIAEALERDLESFERALKEENKRRESSGRAPLFAFEEGGLVRALELPVEPRRDAARDDAPRGAQQERPVAMENALQAALDEARRNAMKSVRRRILSLDGPASEKVATTLLDAEGYKDLNMPRRSAKEGATYLARRRWGSGELRYAIKVIRPGRDLGRADVQELRRDVKQFSAQVGIVIGFGECSREAKSEANLPSETPVMLYGSEGLAEALVAAGLGVQKRIIEAITFDEGFFESVGAGPEARTEEVPVDGRPDNRADRGPGRDRDRDPSRDRNKQRRERIAEARRLQQAQNPSAPAPGEGAPASDAATSEGMPPPEPAAAQGELPMGAPVAAEAAPAREAPPPVEAAPLEPAPTPSEPGPDAV